MEAQVAPPLGHVYHEDPTRPGLHAGEEEHHHGHEKKPVLKKVKEKVKEIKNTISKKTHGHGSGDDHGGLSKEEVSEKEDGYEEDDDERTEDCEVHGAAIAAHDAYAGTSQDPAGGQREERGLEKLPLRAVVGTFQEDPAAPRSGRSTDQVGRDQGGEEIGMSPVIEAFETMAVTEQPPSSTTRSHDQFSPADKATDSIESTKTTPKGGEEHKSYTEKLSTTAKSAASTVYEKVAEAGAAVMEKVQQGTGTTTAGDGDTSSRKSAKGVRVYLAEKLKPGEEDKALCEVITETFRKSKTKEEDTAAVTDAGKVGVIGRIRGAVTSLVGGGRSSRTSPLSESERKAMEDVEVRDAAPEVQRQEEDLE